MIEKLFIDVNGTQQGMFLQSDSEDKPVLLFLHGGPGSPEIPFTQNYPTGLETFFSVCWWEQRGSGISFQKDIPSDTMTIDQMIADTLVVVEFLRLRFKKEKIYLMGHSWGTLLGMLVAQKAPELFHAYMGVGQLVQQAESERLAYKYMLNEFRATGNKRMVCKLEKYPIDQGADIDFAYLSVRGEGLVKLGIGIMHQWRSMLKPVTCVLAYRGYTWKEKLNYPRGNTFCLSCFWDEVLKIDLRERIPRLDIPVYVFHGKFDYQVSYALGKDYLQVLDAPRKGFYPFEDSAHSPCFEEPEKMHRILREDVLAGKTELAD